MGAKKRLKTAGVSAVAKNPKPHNGGEWTDARKRSFAMSALRGARWPVKYQTIKDAYVKDGVNPATGRKCKLHKCAQCGNLFPQKDMAADHIDPVVPIEGFTGETYLGYNWNELIQRLYCEVDGFQALCKECHKLKTADERELRKVNLRKRVVSNANKVNYKLLRSERKLSHKVRRKSHNPAGWAPIRPRSC